MKNKVIVSVGVPNGSEKPKSTYWLGTGESFKAKLLIGTCDGAFHKKGAEGVPLEVKRKCVIVIRSATKNGGCMIFGCDSQNFKESLTKALKAFCASQGLTYAWEQKESVPKSETETVSA